MSERIWLNPTDQTLWPRQIYPDFIEYIRADAVLSDDVMEKLSIAIDHNINSMTREQLKTLLRTIAKEVGCE